MRFLTAADLIDIYRRIRYGTLVEAGCLVWKRIGYNKWLCTDGLLTITDADLAEFVVEDINR